MAVPSKVNPFYNVAAVAPHAVTTRWTYTVPAGRFCVLESAYAWALRDAAAAPAGLVIALVQYTPSGGVSNRVVTAAFLNAAVDTNRQMNWGSELRMKAGDKLEGVTLDLSTGGTVFYSLSAIGTEYDA